MTAVYILDDFIKSCNRSNEVIVLNSALKFAREDFNLSTNKAILEFIANEGLESPWYINTKPWENNPNKANFSIMVDAYSFYSGPKQGYLAFFYNQITKKWLIKSFKNNRDSVPRTSKMIDQLSAYKELMMQVKKGK
ncbi:hypothetical protein SAMN06296273_1190 [Nitrosomonas ureae]|uniref:Uncharacterized protein n=1 Tax=Nitrosomonas ureae TaxID=44577 RepID=A0A285BXW6_9PROT|nr:hypothetical protein [Nitrosomonas ureae]SNX59756.1 hypothetical protein SAMN06296273_1190 [Nitrosomonas ureae]